MVKLHCGGCHKLTSYKIEKNYRRCNECNSLNKIKHTVFNGLDICPCHSKLDEEKDFSITEWLGFEFNEYLDLILVAIVDDAFDLVRAKTSIELLAGKLSVTQVEKLKSVLDKGFRRGQSIRDIAKNIDSKVKPNDLFALDENGNFKLNKKGEKILRIKAKNRSILIARSETTRMANLGAIKHYEQGGVETYRWVASIGTRTCPICMDLNGMTFKINSGILPPVHGACRCTTVPVTELDLS
jgi:SPP1 gp7 family putative phage head morphogenesis protein